MDRNIIDGIIIISLKHRSDRLEKCFEILKNIGMDRDSVSVLEATYTPKNGAKGCSHSHYRAIVHARNMGWKNVLILEDDFNFRVSIEMFNSSLKQIVTSVKHWDVIMLEWGLNGFAQRSSNVNECPLVRKITHKKRGAWLTIAYFANESIYDTLIQNFYKSYELQKERREISIKTYAVDSYWQRLQHSHQWYICIPKLMLCRDISDSDIR